MNPDLIKRLVDDGVISEQRDLIIWKKVDDYLSSFNVSGNYHTRQNDFRDVLTKWNNGSIILPESLESADRFHTCWDSDAAFTDIFRALLKPDFAGTVHAFEGDADYLNLASTMFGVSTVSHSKMRNIQPWFRPRDIFVLSHPSWIDGCLWPDLTRFIRSMLVTCPDTRIVVDLRLTGLIGDDAYGRHVLIDLNFPNIAAVVFSPGIAMGISPSTCAYYLNVTDSPNRISAPTEMLYDIELMREYRYGELATEARPVCVDVVKQINEKYGTSLMISDAAGFATQDGQIFYIAPTVSALINTR